MLKEIKAGTAGPYVFPGADGKPRTDIKRTWASACRKAGLVTADAEPKPNVRIHDLRHSFASILVSAGASLPLIGQMLGHTQVQTTQRYAHLFDDPLRKAAETVGAYIVPQLEGQPVREATDATPA